MNRRSKKKVVAAVLGVLLALSAVTAAVAYFTGASGSANGSATVGTSSAWTVTLGTPTFSSGLSAIYPGAGTELIPFTVTNNGKGNQAVTSIAPSVMTFPSSTDAETTGGTDISGCTATWFTVAPDAGNAALPNDVAPGGTYTGKIDVTMPDLATTNQNACKSASPGITVTAS